MKVYGPTSPSLEKRKKQPYGRRNLERDKGNLETGSQNGSDHSPPAHRYRDLRRLSGAA
jgi:hypothetical protein